MAASRFLTPLDDQRQIVDQFGLAAGIWSAPPLGEPVLPASHSHLEVELNLSSGGTMTYLLGGELRTLSPDRVGVFWAGTPHSVIELGAGLKWLVWVTIPLAQVLHWDLPPGFLAGLLEGRLLQEPAGDGDVRSADIMAFRRWARESSAPAARRVMLLEIEARTRRLAASVELKDRVATRSAPTRAAKVTTIAEIAAERYRDVIGVPDLAAAAGLHPGYAGRLFKRTTGIGLWEYILRLRVAHAQRLLITTDLGVLDVCHEAGFGSEARFYEAFQRFTGMPPRRFRATLGEPPRGPRTTRESGGGSPPGSRVDLSTLCRGS